MKEIISLHIGQAGISFGEDIWELFCLEHQIDPDGTFNQKKAKEIGQQFQAYFHQNKEKKFSPRAIHADLEPFFIDEISGGRNRKLFRPQNFVAEKGGGGSTFARGYCSVGKKVIDHLMETIRKQAEKCNDLDGFIIYNSLGGGAGSGLGSLLLQKLSSEYSAKSKVGFNIYPSFEKGNELVSPYNTVLAAHSIIENECTSIVLDNQALHRICNSDLDYDTTHNQECNKLAAHLVSAVTAPTRVEGPLNFTLPQLSESLIPFHRFRFIVSSLAPLIGSEKCCGNVDDMDITMAAFQNGRSMVTCDLRHGKYLSSRIHYRGDFSHRDINFAVNSLKSHKNIRFANWCPLGFKISVNYDKPKVFPNDLIRSERRFCCMMSNNTAVSELLSRYNWKFNRMYSMKAFVHWYTKEGMEEAEFAAAYHDIKELIQDYQMAQQDQQEEKENDLVEQPKQKQSEC